MKVISPSRTYVAVCPKGNFDGHFFRKFRLPEKDPWERHSDFENNSEVAGWFFLNRLDSVSMLDFCVTAEDWDGGFKVIPQDDKGNRTFEE